MSQLSRKVLIVVSAVALLGCANATGLGRKPAPDSVQHERPYDLSTQELRALQKSANGGDCNAAYRVGQYHLYSSLDLLSAEKYFRIAVKCPIPNAFAGLITVLRRPESDHEVDALVLKLSELDSKVGQEAATEVEFRRAERKSR